MVDTAAILHAISKQSVTMLDVSKEMGISKSALWKKTRNETEFYANEIELFCKIVGVSTRKEKEAMFFRDNP